MFGVRLSSSTGSSNYRLETTALTVVSPFSGGHSKLQHFPNHCRPQRLLFSPHTEIGVGRKSML